MDKEDLIAGINISFKQIIALADLMIDCDNDLSPNILTIRDIAQAGQSKLTYFEEL